MNKDMNKLLTIVVPAYNVQEYLEKCVCSILPYNFPLADQLEVLIVNDGSKDKTSDIANNLAKKNKQVRVINKENGGHGSTINVGIEEASGKYLRIIDGDDWVDTSALISSMEFLSKNEIDILLTDASYDYKDKKELEPYVKYNLEEGKIYTIDDVLINCDKLGQFGPVLAASTYKTEGLRKGNFKLTEHSAYVDMELNAYSLKEINTIAYLSLDIYRYFIGRSDQSVAPNTWKKKYKEHENIIWTLISFVQQDKEISSVKKQYIVDKLISPMVDSEIFMYDQLCKWDELEFFLTKLIVDSEIYTACISYVYNKNGDCKKILAEYKNAANEHRTEPIISAVTNINQVLNDEESSESKIHNGTIYFLVRKIIKCMLPYGVVRLYQKYKYK